MGLLENLAQGFASAAGDIQSVDAIRRKKDDRTATAHEQLQAQTQMTLDEVERLHGEKAKLNPDTDVKTIQAIDKRLGELQQHFTDLYHPEKNPGALQHLGGFIKSHLGRKQTQIPKTPGEAKAQFSFAGSPAGTTPPTAAEDKIGLWMKDANGNLIPARLENGKAVPIALPQGMTAEGSTAPKSGKYSLVSGTVNGQPITLQHGADGSWRTLNGEEVDESTLSAFQPTQKSSTAPKVGSFGDFLIQAYGQHPTPEQYEQGRKLWAQSGAGTTVGEHVIMVPQPDGSIKAFTVQTTSTKSFGADAIPKTPGEAKKKVPKPGAGVVGGGTTLGGRMTPPQVAAKKEYDEAVALSDTADQVAQKPNDAINQKRLAVALERASAGRFTTQALDYIIKAGWGNTIEQWANNPTTGALPSDVLRQLVDGAHQNLHAKKAALDASGMPNAASPTSSKEIHYKIVNGQLVAQ